MKTKSNQVVIITGASKGLGRELALAFAKQGANLALCARNEELLFQVKAEAEELGAIVLAVAADLSIGRDVEKFAACIEKVFGRVDVLINNASVLGPSPMPYLVDYPEDDYHEVVRINTVSPFLMTKRVLPSMLQNGRGSIINVTSEAGNTGYAGWGAYGISKFAIEGLTQTWADEVSGTGVIINMVDPGEMDTDMHALAVPDCTYALNDPADVCGVFLFLASEKALNVNGQRLDAVEFREGGSSYAD